MGRRLTLSTPTIIQTELVPLDESFYLDYDGQLEQWYYDNTNEYAPNRKYSPLTITPRISVFDKDTETSYNPAFYTVRWFEKAYNATMTVNHWFGLSEYETTSDASTAPSDISTWSSQPPTPTAEKPYIWVKKVESATVSGVAKSVTTYFLFDEDATYPSTSVGGYWEEEITNIVDSANADYVKVGNTLLVKKNVSYSHGVTIRCEAKYIDPRDAGIVYTTGDTCLLTTNRDATIIYPAIDVENPSSQAYNPIVQTTLDNGVINYHSQFTLKATADWSSVVPVELVAYKVEVGGTEEILPTTDNVAPTLDIRYGDVLQTSQSFMSRTTAEGSVSTIDGNTAHVERIKGNAQVVDGTLQCVKITAFKTTGGSGLSTWEAQQPFDVTKLKGKLNGTGSEVLVFEDGMKKDINGVCDEMYVQNGVVYAIMRVGSRAYNSATDSALLNDGTTTFYKLNTAGTFVVTNLPKGQFEWYAINNNTEVLAETMPWYVSGQHTDELKVDAMFGEDIRVVLRAKAKAGDTTLFPNKVYRSILWRIPDVDTHVASQNGSAVRSTTDKMTFQTICNVKGSVLNEQVKAAHLRMNWKTRKNNSATEQDAEWGLEKTIDASVLRNSIGAQNNPLASTMVFPYVYLMGAYEAVSDDNVDVTDGGEQVYDRPVGIE